MELIYILLLHLVADFWLQDRETAKKKSHKLSFLAKHIAMNYTVFCIGMSLFLITRNDPLTIYPKLFIFCFLNALSHGIIDWHIWKIYRIWTVFRNPEVTIETLKKNWQYWEDNNFWLTMGIDQFLHTATIVGLYNWLLLFPV
jgi:hypothetical protein